MQCVIYQNAYCHCGIICMESKTGNGCFLGLHFKLVYKYEFQRFIRAEISDASITSTSGKIKRNLPQHVAQRGPATVLNLMCLHLRSTIIPSKVYLCSSNTPLLITATRFLQSLQVLRREACQASSACSFVLLHLALTSISLIGQVSVAKLRHFFFFLCYHCSFMQIAVTKCK